jgi:CheY-like chemotaxis protein
MAVVVSAALLMHAGASAALTGKIDCTRIARRRERKQTASNQQETPKTVSQNIPSQQQSAVWLRKPRIFVLDDERLIADTLANILCLNGYDAVALYTASAALELAEKAMPDLLITDVALSPDSINGIDLAIYFERQYPECAVILISGHAGSLDLHRKARRSGHQFTLLQKPIPPDQMLEVVGKKLEQLRVPSEQLRKAG